MRSILTWFSHIVCGIWFIISGFVKVVDPVAFSRKLDEYFEKVFHLPFLNPYSIGLAMSVSILEIVIGAALLVAFRMRITAWATLGMMLYFTFLTGYSALTGVVKSCGCFGEVIKFTPEQSFVKDLIIMLFVGIIFRNRKRTTPYIQDERWVNLIVVLFLTFTGWVSIYSYRNTPFIEFGEYKNGKPFPVLGLEKDYSKGNIIYVLLDVKKPIPQWGSLDKLATESNVPYTIVGLSGELSADVAHFAKVKNAHFPIYSTDKDVLKMITRSFPSCIWVKDNIISYKWSKFHLPTVDKIKKKCNAS